MFRFGIGLGLCWGLDFGLGLCLGLDPGLGLGFGLGSGFVWVLRDIDISNYMYIVNWVF